MEKVEKQLMRNGLACDMFEVCGFEEVEIRGDGLLVKMLLDRRSQRIYY